MVWRILKGVFFPFFTDFIPYRWIDLDIRRNISYKIAYSTTGKELSEIKSFGIVKQYFYELYKNIFKSKVMLYEIFQRISVSIQRYGIKSKKKQKKTAIKILKTTKMTENVLLKMAV